MEHAMKFLERAVDRMLRKIVDFDGMQLGLMKHAWVSIEPFPVCGSARCVKRSVRKEEEWELL